MIDKSRISILKVGTQKGQIERDAQELPISGSNISTSRIAGRIKDFCTDANPRALRAWAAQSGVTWVDLPGAGLYVSGDKLDWASLPPP
jgi:hypothetical protein